MRSTPVANTPGHVRREHAIFLVAAHLALARSRSAWALLSQLSLRIRCIAPVGADQQKSLHARGSRAVERPLDQRHGLVELPKRRTDEVDGRTGSRTGPAQKAAFSFGSQTYCSQQGYVLKADLGWRDGCARRPGGPPVARLTVGLSARPTEPFAPSKTTFPRILIGFYATCVAAGQQAGQPGQTDVKIVPAKTLRFRFPADVGG